jgi:hypothetical protein
MRQLSDGPNVNNKTNAPPSPSSDLVNDAFEDLAHALRVLIEAHIRAHQGLLQVDRAEAVGNIDNAFASVLNAFHSLYDALNKDGAPVNWYDIPELSVVLALRNARHHNLANKIRTLYTYHGQEAEKIPDLTSYVLVNFPAQEEGASTFEVYVSWGDLKELLSLPTSVSRIRSQTAKQIIEYLQAEKFAGYARDYGLAEGRVFVNAVPLIVNAAAKIVPLIKSKISPRSMESELYLRLFEDMLPALMQKPEVNCGPIALMP